MRFGNMKFAALFVLAYCVLSPAQAAGPGYTITALEILPGGLDSAAYGINESGQVVGDSTLDRSGNVGRSRPVIWNDAGQPSELWSMSGPNPWGGMPLAINNAAQVVGRYGAGSGVPLPSLTIRPGAAFIWDSVQGMRDLGSLGGLNAEAVAINESGQVVGTSETPTGGRAFIWDSVNGMRDLGSLGGTWSFGLGINKTGQVVGRSWGPNNVGESAFIWDAVNGMRELESPTGGATRAVAINDAGQVLGYEIFSSTSAGGMVIWGAGIVFVPRQAGTSLLPYDINNYGQVVGRFREPGDADNEAFLWEPDTGFVNLEDLIANGSNWDFNSAHAISDVGQIVGFGTFNGERRGFLLTPVPEPSTVFLAFIAALAVAIAISRRVNLRKFGS
jgi:probable HAF family extracellular repeat protein